MATTRHALYREILTAVKAASSLDNSMIYLVDRPRRDPIRPECIQISHSGSQSLHPMSGCQLIQTTFRLAYWYRAWTDEASQSTDRISDATESLLTIADEAREALVHSVLSGVSVTPVVFLSDSVMQEDDEAPGWIFSEDTFRVDWSWT